MCCCLEGISYGCCGGGGCSECVGNATCDTALCSACLTGDLSCAQNITPGTCVGICQNAICESGGRCLRCCDVLACQDAPCSPSSCGSTDQPPCACVSHKSAPLGGGSGGGSAGSSGGGSRGGANAGTQCVSKLSQAMNRFGSTITGLLTGGKRVAAGAVLPGQAVSTHPPATAISSNAFLLIIVIVGILLLVMAFGHKPEGD